MFRKPEKRIRLYYFKCPLIAVGCKKPYGPMDSDRAHIDQQFQSHLANEHQTGIIRSREFNLEVASDG